MRKHKQFRNGTGEVLRASLNITGIPAWEILSQTMGKPIPELMKMSEQGKLMADQVIPALVQGMGERFGGAMEKQSQTFNGLMSTLKDNLKSFSAMITSDLFEKVKSFLPPIIDFINRLSDAFKNAGWKGVIQEILPPQVASFITQNLGILKQLISDFVTFGKDIWKKYGDEVSTTAKATWEAISQTIKGLLEIIRGVIKTVLSLLTGDWKGAWEGIKSIAKGVWDTIGGVIKNATNGIQNIIKASLEIVKNIFSTVWNGIKALVSTIWNAIKSTISTTLSGITSNIQSIWNNIKNFMSNTLNTIKNTVSNIWNGIKSSISSTINNISSTVSSVFNSVKSKVSSIFNSIKSTATSVWNGIKTAITSPIESAKKTVLSIINSIKSAFSKLKISIPKPKLPHISVDWKSIGVGDLKAKIPDFDISWYATGGIFDKPSIVGLAEQGREAILPLENPTYMAPFADAVYQRLKERMQNTTNNNNNQQINLYTTYHFDFKTKLDKTELERVAHYFAEQQINTLKKWGVSIRSRGIR
jgi:archaellum component FlaC